MNSGQKQTQEIFDRMQGNLNHPVAVGLTRERLNKALEHTLNFNGIDAQCGTSDIVLAEQLSTELLKHILGITDVQIFDSMTPEERTKIGQENKG